MLSYVQNLFSKSRSCEASWTGCLLDSFTEDYDLNKFLSLLRDTYAAYFLPVCLQIILVVSYIIYAEVKLRNLGKNVYKLYGELQEFQTNFWQWNCRKKETMDRGCNTSGSGKHAKNTSKKNKKKLTDNKVLSRQDSKLCLQLDPKPTNLTLDESQTKELRKKKDDSITGFPGMVTSNDVDILIIPKNYKPITERLTKLYSVLNSNDTLDLDVPLSTLDNKDIPRSYNQVDIVVQCLKLVSLRRNKTHVEKPEMKNDTHNFGGQKAKPDHRTQPRLSEELVPNNAKVLNLRQKEKEKRWLRLVELHEKKKRERERKEKEMAEKKIKEVEAKKQQEEKLRRKRLLQIAKLRAKNKIMRQSTLQSIKLETWPSFTTLEPEVTNNKTNETKLKRPDKTVLIKQPQITETIKEENKPLEPKVSKVKSDSTLVTTFSLQGSLRQECLKVIKKMNYENQLEKELKSDELTRAATPKNQSDQCNSDISEKQISSVNSSKIVSHNNLKSLWIRERKHKLVEQGFYKKFDSEICTTKHEQFLQSHATEHNAELKMKKCRKSSTGPKLNHAARLRLQNISLPGSPRAEDKDSMKSFSAPTTPRRFFN
ncbi:DNA ligase 1-like [Cimex lectularius]|uniref:Uncharacterized protein n=1 Tax=Cimex lectularius TaxID=79782 RepID=A0A8I6R9V0_CIMLE|nr:DNA ligase 1-like [Cimex lectularius]